MAGEAIRVLGTDVLCLGDKRQDLLVRVRHNPNACLRTLFKERMSDWKERKG